MKKNYVLDKLLRGISSQQQVAGSKLQVGTFMKRKCEPVPNILLPYPLTNGSHQSASGYEGWGCGVVTEF